MEEIVKEFEEDTKDFLESNKDVLKELKENFNMELKEGPNGFTLTVEGETPKDDSEIKETE